MLLLLLFNSVIPRKVVNFWAMLKQDFLQAQNSVANQCHRLRGKTWAIFTHVYVSTSYGAYECWQCLYYNKCKKLTSLKLGVRTTWWSQTSKTAKIFWGTLDGGSARRSLQADSSWHSLALSKHRLKLTLHKKAHELNTIYYWQHFKLQRC